MIKINVGKVIITALVATISVIVFVVIGILIGFLPVSIVAAVGIAYYLQRNKEKKKAEDKTESV